MVLGSPKQRNLLPGVTHDQAMEYAADVLRACRRRWRVRRGVAAEPLGPLEGDFLRTAELGIRLVEMVGSPHCRMHLDIQSHVHRAETDRGHHPRQRTVDRAFSRQQPQHARPWHGRCQLPADLRGVMQEINYQGWVSVEVFDYTPGVETLARDSIEYMQRCLAEI